MSDQINQTGSIPAALTAANARQQLTKRAGLLADIRNYFSEQGVLEVETPLLGRCPVSDPHLDNLRTLKPFNTQKLLNRDDDNWLYLQTSPEYAMKQLLARGSGSIYQIGKAFREDPVGRLHGIEFTMLEWYRVGFQLSELMNEVSSLVSRLIGHRQVEVISYRDAFIKHVGLNPFLANSEQLSDLARHIVDIDIADSSNDVWLDLLLTHMVEPQLGAGVLTFLYDYPASQAALAKTHVDDHGNEVAARFELYIEGIEIANGYDELTDLETYLQRFETDNARRAIMGKDSVSLDRDFVAALNDGLPQCAGVALGIDRLMLFV